MINRVTLVGRLTQDVEVKHTESGIAVANFTVAVERHFKNAEGEKQADFVTCKMWRKSAENFANFTCKGSLVGILGEVRTHTYEKDGQKVYRTDIEADTFALLEPKAVTEARRAGTLKSGSGGGSDNVFAAAGANGEKIDITDDDLPF
ncbi:single-stranded DNA-binding protein [Schleiferilactobacillus shenzhenensis]|uniref:Single-stranded DNA-binding protein n=1 Tax=Schleiferilactobacillus shenzhenensis LY-73 TaxID=1231336 RepID=U4TRH1_9LACO|nr:single-stranded DNA-binding protein [Schleiferilactobacillus shenzhenensis]ERL64102.1 Ssb4 [Schleiferilactobacillus shenzhenensis LY-73]